VWTADGRRIAFGSTRTGTNSSGVLNLFWQRSDGTGVVERLATSPTAQFAGSFHPGGKFLAFTEFHPGTNFDVMILPIEGDEASGWKPGKPTVFLNGPFAEQEPMFSPDGRWLAYMSNESGLYEVYVRPFPGPGGKWQISSGGGTYPMWSRSKSEVLYSTANRPQLMAVPYAVEADSFRADKPQPIPNAFPRTRSRQRSVALHPDGDRFAVAADEQAASKNDHVRFIFNFFDELRRVAPARN
jgi:serine/threonine-protein kinase